MHLNTFYSLTSQSTKLRCQTGRELNSRIPQALGRARSSSPVHLRPPSPHKAGPGPGLGVPGRSAVPRAGPEKGKEPGGKGGGDEPPLVRQAPPGSGDTPTASRKGGTRHGAHSLLPRSLLGEPGTEPKPSPGPGPRPPPPVPHTHCSAGHRAAAFPPSRAALSAQLAPGHAPGCGMPSRLMRPAEPRPPQSRSSQCPSPSGCPDGLGGPAARFRTRHGAPPRGL